MGWACQRALGMSHDEDLKDCLMEKDLVEYPVSEDWNLLVPPLPLDGGCQPLET